MRIKDYTGFILETELKHISEGGVSKLSLLTILTIFVKLFKMDHFKKYLPVSVKNLSDEHIADAQHLKRYFKEIFEPIAVLTKKEKKPLEYEDLTEKLHEKPFHYIYYDAKKPILLMISTIDFTPIKKDFLYDPKEFYVVPDIKKVNYEMVEEFLYASGVRDQTIIDNHWDRILDKNPLVIDQANAEMSQHMQNKWKHLSAEYGFLKD